MAEDELAQIRARRMAELRAQHGGGAVGGGAGPQGDPQQRAQQQQEQRQKDEDFRNSILSQVLSQQAGARLNTLKAVKPDKARMVEDILIQNARMGRFSGKLSEEELKDILERVSAQTAKKETTVQYSRRYALDSDEDDLSG